MDTTYVNFFAGPGAGKSTLAAKTFAALKEAGVNTELVTEFAKDLVWEGSEHLLGFQVRLFSEQHYRTIRLQNKVRVVVTDSPFFLSLIYGAECGTQFTQFVRYEWEKLDNINFFVKRRDFPYNPRGRIHNEEEARDLDAQIKMALQDYRVPFEYIDYGDAEYVAKQALEYIDAAKA